MDSSLHDFQTDLGLTLLLLNFRIPLLTVHRVQVHFFLLTYTLQGFAILLVRLEDISRRTGGMNHKFHFIISQNNISQTEVDLNRFCSRYVKY